VRRLRVLLHGMLAALRRGGAFTALALLRDVRPFVRVNFLVAAHEMGLFAALAERPASLPDLVERLGVTRPDLLEILLGLGVELGELRRGGDAYRLRGRRATALAGPAGDVLSALLEELVLYHGVVYRDLPGLLRGAAAPDYLAEAGAIIARSSRVAEPFVASWVRELLRGHDAPRVLDVGCGSGVYLGVAAQASPRATGAGIELRPEVVAQARANLGQWEIADRFEIVPGDARTALDSVGRGFDLVLAANNVYYFTPEERTELFGRLRETLAAGGSLAVVSLFRGGSLTTRNLDLVLAATPGCHPLPSLESVVGELRDAGFDRPAASPLVPGDSLYVVVARPLPAAAAPAGEGRPVELSR
jgi:SAM-dependent methyltransferase